jgi:hypothetical protein
VHHASRVDGGSGGKCHVRMTAATAEADGGVVARPLLRAQEALAAAQLPTQASSDEDVESPPAPIMPDGGHLFLP